MAALGAALPVPETQSAELHGQRLERFATLAQRQPRYCKLQASIIQALCPKLLMSATAGIRLSHAYTGLVILALQTQIVIYARSAVT